MDNRLKKLKKQIIQWAKTHDSAVSYTIIADILKEEWNDIDDKYLAQMVYELETAGIVIESYERDETYEADAGEPEKFIPADVNIGQKSMNVYNLMERLKYNEINLQPDFQRRGGLWTDEQQSKLIESLMLKIPLPAFYFDA
ncbi:MAG: hypothetical protein K2P43_13605, partial [Lachnospiraceae bacterium]|nr:hypothetical protein [Lachnospiraceae bacterium]